MMFGVITNNLLNKMVVVAVAMAAASDIYADMIYICFKSI